jgi:1-deoxy-D-xylulose-5-phosphate reductoisomerase
MGLPDMRLPIQYALSYPDRLKSDFPRLNFSDYPTLTFEKPDLETFRNLALSYQALEKGGNLPCVLNAANEVAVDAFLKESIGFLDISSVIEESMGTIGFIENPILDDFVETDIETRIKAKEIISKWEVH